MSLQNWDVGRQGERGYWTVNYTGSKAIWPLYLTIRGLGLKKKYYSSKKLKMIKNHELLNLCKKKVRIERVYNILATASLYSKGYKRAEK